MTLLLKFKTFLEKASSVNTQKRYALCCFTSCGCLQKATVLTFKVHLSLWTEIRAQRRVIHDVCAHCSMTDSLQAKKDILLFSSRKSAVKRTFYSARLGLYFEKGSIHFASIMDTNTVYSLYIQNNTDSKVKTFCTDGHLSAFFSLSLELI